MTPTIYAAAWLILATYKGGVQAIPMPSMQACQFQAGEIKDKQIVRTTAYCIDGGA